KGCLHPLQGIAQIFKYIVKMVEDPRSNVALFWMAKPSPSQPYVVTMNVRRWPEGDFEEKIIVIFDGEKEDEVNSGLSFHFQRSGGTIGLSVLRYDTILLTSSIRGAGAMDRIEIFHYADVFWVDVNGRRMMKPVELPAVSTGTIGVGLTPALGLDDFTIARLTQR
ncbi:MAG: hypothetical protein WC712_12615, partial [Candidatus Brocadiia bacterium]